MWVESDSPNLGDRIRHKASWMEYVVKSVEDDKVIFDLGFRKGEHSVSMERFKKSWEIWENAS